MNNEINLYEELKKAILKEANDSLNDFEMVKEKFLKLFDMIMHINFNNMNSKEKIDYNELQRTDGNIIKFNLLSLLFDFRNKCHDDDFYETFVDSLEIYRNTEINMEERLIESNGTVGYETVKFAILKSVKNLLNEYDNVKNKVLKLLNVISSVDSDNMTIKQKKDYEIMIITDLNIKRLNDLTILFNFIDNPCNKEIYEIFMKNIEKYRERQVSVKYIEKTAVKHAEKSRKIQVIKEQISKRDIKWLDVPKDKSEDIEAQNEIENKIDESNILKNISETEEMLNEFDNLESQCVIREVNYDSNPNFENQNDINKMKLDHDDNFENQDDINQVKLDHDDDFENQNATYENEENIEPENVEKHSCLKKFLKKYILK